jgi:hypothetical protein
MNGKRFGPAPLEQRGTRFRLFPQAPILSSITHPEIVWVSAPAGSIGPGPSDNRMYVVDAIGKKPYEYPYLPPYRGPHHRPVEPGPDGHFDHLTDASSREFMAAHMYGTLRFVLDVWEKYFGGPLPWHFQEYRPRLELVPLVEWDNAHSGYGFIETGYARPGAPDPQPFCLNFDVLAHELGHSFIYESASDCVAMFAAMHFDSVVDRLLERSSGNIYLPNELNRIGELSDNHEIRLASQSVTLDDVAHLRTPPSRLSQRERHDMSLPLTGAIFDIFVDVYQTLLVHDGLITPELNARSRPELSDVDEVEVQAEFDRAYAGHHAGFKAVLADARDYMGRCLASSWRRLSWDVTYAGVAAAMLAADREIARGAGQRIISESLLWRGIKGSPFSRGRQTYAERVAKAGVRC